MSLSHEQYETIMRGYDDLRLQHRRELEERREQAYAALPRLRELDGEAAAVSMRRARALLLPDEERTKAPAMTAEELSDALEAIRGERLELLRANGFPEDWLEPAFTCPLCRDTGYADGEKCACLLRKERDLLDRQSGLLGQLREASFEAFSLDYYSCDAPAGGLSPREEAARALAVSKQYVDAFGAPDAERDLCFYGSVGVGKTFLSCCIASGLLAKGHSVLYRPSYELFESLGRYTFSSDENERPTHDAVFSCDLLIIDDLGTELTNSFVASQLFLIMNERELRRKATILSTNIPPEAFADTFSERISSRLLGSYRLIHLSGTDIRLRKKLTGGN